MSEENISINILTDECMCGIFKFLSLPERWIASQVCKRWFDIDRIPSHQIKTLDTSQDVWWDLLVHLNESNIESTFARILLKYGKYITSLNYVRMNDGLLAKSGHSLEHIIKACPNLEKIIIRSYIEQIDTIRILQKYHKLTELRLNSALIESDIKLTEFFRKNSNLKRLEMNFDYNQGVSLMEINKTSIEELRIRIGSQEVIDTLTLVLRETLNLKIFSIEDKNRHLTSWLFNVIKSIPNLEELTLKLPCSPTVLYTLITNLNNLIKLEILSQQVLKDDVLLVLIQKLDRLRSLNISGCLGVTDRGLKACSKLNNLDELTIKDLVIGGEGLEEFRSLKSINCSYSKIFDEPLLNVIKRNERLEYVNLERCSNITINTIDNITRTIERRENRKILTVVSDIELVSQSKMKAPHWLEFTGSKILNQTNQALAQYQVYGSIGKSLNSIRMITDWMDDMVPENIFVPYIHEYSIDYIVKFIPVPQRVKLQRVSQIWQTLIERSWRFVQKIDFTNGEWSRILFYKNSTQVQYIIQITLEKIGQSLELVGIKDEWGILTVCKKCPALKAIKIYPSNNYDVSPMIMYLSQFYDNLIQLSLSFWNIKDSVLINIFKSNQNLRVLNLYNFSTLRSKCMLALNHPVLKTLRFHWSHIDPYEQEITTHFAMMLTKMVNLETLVFLSGKLDTNLLMHSIGECNHLQTLLLQPQYWSQGDYNFDTILKFTRLKKFSLVRNQQLTDDFLQLLAINCELLSHINITGCKNVTDQGLEAIGQLPYLHTLIIADLVEIDGTGLYALASTTLRRLDCQNCISVRNEPLCHVLENCPYLELLNIYNCRIIGEKVIEIAFQVAGNRTNRIPLKLISHKSLVQIKRKITPVLLELLVLIEKEQ